MSENVNEVVNNEDEFTPEYFAIVETSEEVVFVSDDYDEASLVCADKTARAVAEELEDMGYDPDEENESAYAGVSFQAGYNGNDYSVVDVEITEPTDSSEVVWTSKSGQEFTLQELRDLKERCAESEGDLEDEDDDLGFGYSDSDDMYDGEDDFDDDEDEDEDDNY